MTHLRTQSDFDTALLSEACLADPYRFYAQLRENAPFYGSSRLDAWVLTRYDSPIQHQTRIAKQDFQLHGHDIRRGQRAAG